MDVAIAYSTFGKKNMQLPLYQENQVSLKNVKITVLKGKLFMPCDAILCPSGRLTGILRAVLTSTHLVNHHKTLLYQNITENNTVLNGCSS